jgi:hypothetical protein
MGYRICYIASPIPPGELAASLGLTVKGTSDEMPDGEWLVAKLKSSGWSVLWAEDEDFGKTARTTLIDLSRAADVILCEVNETVMWSSAEAFRNGASVWRIAHAGDGEDRYDLTVEGNPPEGFAAIRQALEQEQRDDDGTVDFIFEIPLDVAAASHGFRHDRYLEAAAVETFHLRNV